MIFSLLLLLLVATHALRTGTARLSVRPATSRASVPPCMKGAQSRDDMLNQMQQIEDRGKGAWTVSEPAAAPGMPEPEPETVAQIHADADAVFALLDLDGDERLTLEELSWHLGGAGYSQPAVDNIFSTLCADSDCRISTISEECDDRTVSRDELRQCFERFATLREVPGLVNTKEPSTKELTAEVERAADELFDAIDTDGDGQISKAELQARLTKESAYSMRASDKVFDAIDTNSDDKISRDELRGGMVRYSALRLALGVGKPFDNFGKADEDPGAAPGEDTVEGEVRYLW